jgi:hypothetical protein
MEPLIKALGWPILNLNQCGKILKLNHAYFYRMLKDGVTANVADRLACNILGEHPVSIWGPAWWDALDFDHPENV